MTNSSSTTSPPQALMSTNAHVQASPVLPTAPIGSDATLWAAIIGAGSALLVSFLKDFLFEWLKERRARLQTQAEVYRQYLAPLCETSEKIVWRSKEIFIDKRHAFLKTTTLPLDFNAYKRISTLYRIATLIGWIRGMNLELRALPHGRSNFATPISKQIMAFQKALADGPHVELHRLTRLSALWSIDLSGLDQVQQAALAMRFEVEAHAATGGNLKSNPDHLRNLPASEKLTICKRLTAYLAKETGSKTPDEDIIRETMERAVGSLSYREALLYRDWQDALGDAMIERDPDSVRRFRIIGYEKFTALLKTESPWFKILAKSIDDIDFDEIDPSDFRSQQLRDMSAAVAAILTGIAQTKDSFFVDPECLKAAIELKNVITVPAITGA